MRVLMTKKDYKSTRNRDTYTQRVNKILDTPKWVGYASPPKDFKCKTYKCNSRTLKSEVAKHPHNYKWMCHNGHYFKFDNKPIKK